MFPIFHGGIFPEKLVFINRNCKNNFNVLESALIVQKWSDSWTDYKHCKGGYYNINVPAFYCEFSRTIARCLKTNIQRRMYILTVTQISVWYSPLKVKRDRAGTICHSLSVTPAIGIWSVYLYFSPHIFISMVV